MQDTIERTILLRAPVGKVWAALSDAEEFGRWFKARISGTFAVGQTVQCTSTYPGAEGAGWEMTITEMTPNVCLAYTWPAYYGEDADRDGTEDPALTVTFTLVPEDGGTRLTLVESGFASLPPDYAPTAWRLNEQGWDEQVKNIAAHVTV